MASSYIGLNDKNVSKIRSALKAYAAAVTSVDFGATSKTVQIYAKGTASEKAIVAALNDVEKAMDNLVNNLIKPFDDRLSQLKGAYVKNDSSQGSSFSSSTKNMLKS